jgi:hypothetical protein
VIGVRYIMGRVLTKTDAVHCDWLNNEQDKTICGTMGKSTLLRSFVLGIIEMITSIH